MVVANVVSEFQIGNAQIKIADNYCRKTACEVDRILKRIATQAQRQFNAAAAAGKYEQEQDAEIPSDCCNPCGDGSPRVGGGHGDSTGGSGHAERGRRDRAPERHIHGADGGATAHGPGDHRRRGPPYGHDRAGAGGDGTALPEHDT